MFKVKASDEIVKHCEKCLEVTNFGQRKEANGTRDQQLTGLIGQSVVMDLFECGYIDSSKGFDGGVDLEYMDFTIDVKTMGRNSEPEYSYTNNFLKLQDYFNTEIYIFCSYHKKKQEVTICGWIDKSEFKEKRRYCPKGTIRTRNDNTTFETLHDLYEIDNKDLNDVDSITDLKIQLVKKYKEKKNILYPNNII
jgi:hypothetical protein